MKSPTGYTYEYDTIEQWLNTKGETCPITGKVNTNIKTKPLKMCDLILDTELVTKITQV